MLEVNKLSRKYGNFLAVDSVGFFIKKGEIVGLLGQNGAGKTSIMKMLSGYLEPNEGCIKINGADLTHQPKKTQEYLGYLPENLPLYPELTVIDYLDYSASLKRIEKEKKKDEIIRVIQSTNIEDKILSPISNLSRGYKQRVGVAQAILGNPQILILDEPTNGLDPSQTKQMRALIKDLSKNATVILSTHIMQEVDALCDRVLILSEGKLIVDAKLEDVRVNKHLLLKTNMQKKEAEEKISKIKGIDSIQLLENKNRSQAGSSHLQYKITPSKNSDIYKTSSELAVLVIRSQSELFELQIEKRNLESLFRDVSKKDIKSIHSEEEVYAR